MNNEKSDYKKLSEEEKTQRDTEKKKIIENEIEKIEKAVLPEEQKARLKRYVTDMIEKDIKLSWNDFMQLAIKFANEKDEEFYEFVQANYETLKKRRRAEPYVSPAAVVVGAESLIGIAAAIGIGIGWVWIWLAVSPYSVTENTST